MKAFAIKYLYKCVLFIKHQMQTISFPYFEWDGYAHNRKQLVTSLPLDYEMIPTYTLILSANDGSFSDTIRVIVNVVDENDNSPNFVNDTTAYAFSVLENLSPGIMIGKVEVRWAIVYTWTFVTVVKRLLIIFV